MRHEMNATTGLAGIVAAVLNLNDAEVTDEDGPATLAGWTSRRHMELVVRLEEAYQVSLSAREAFAVSSIGELRELLRGKGAAC